MQKSEREYMEVLAYWNVKVASVRRGKHTIAKCVSPTGKHFNVCIPSTPSDVRGIKNFRSKVAMHCAR